MAYTQTQDRGKSRIKDSILFLLFFAVALLILAATVSRGQTPAASPSPSAATSNQTVVFGGYNLTTSVEFGVRGISVNGNDNKYRSDFNYRPGFRLFDSSFLLENKDSKSRAIDSLLVTSSGWNSDPSGYTRISVERDGFYKFDSKIRQVVYFNNLNNHARGGHTSDTRHNFGDFDLTLYPKSDKLRLRFGGGYNRTNGSGSITSRAYSDEFPVVSSVDTGAIDLRAGLDTQLFGFNMSLSFGHRRFKDDTHYTTTDNIGYNTTNSTVIRTFDRSYPIKGATNYGLFNIQRTFADKLDLTGRFIYSLTDRNIGFSELIIGRDSSNNIIDSDTFSIRGKSKRPQARADFGLTYAVTSNFRISDSFSYEQFNISGNSSIEEAIYSRTSSGGTRTGYPAFPSSRYYRLTSFKRYVNTIEGDYQFSDRFGVHLGYRYSHRKIDLEGYNFTIRNSSGVPQTVNNPSGRCSVATSEIPYVICEDEENTTNTVIAGFKAKPMKNWVIFADIERGDADNAFTRLANYKFTNARIRSRWSFDRLVFNVSFITKDNENPSFSTAPQGNVSGEFTANTKSRLFSAYADWTPSGRLSFSGGYTFQRLTSQTDIVINTGTLVRGISEYYMRDHYGFFDVTAQPFKRVTFYAGFNHNEDLGQGSRVSVLPNLISSYPFRLFSAESRLAFRLTRNIEWNLGYQYIGYREALQPLSNGVPQDYHANLPYTSLRIYFGGGER